MKLGAIVLRNHKNAVGSIGYEGVIDALLSGGVFFDELTLIPYDQPSLFASALSRMKCEYGGVIVVCDVALLPYAREQSSLLCQLDGDDISRGECLIALLPIGEQGISLATRLVLPEIDRLRRKRYSRMVLRAVGVPAQKLNELLEEAQKLSGDQIVYNVCERDLNVRIEAVYDSNTPKMLADDVLRILASGLQEYLYATEDVDLAARLVDALKLHRLKVATAESFTGGGVGREIVKISGASAVFYEGLNTYDNGSKEGRLGVSPYTLKSHGAVSDEVAYEMAAGLLQGGKCDLSIATTGIAGPLSDNTQKPVGLCYIAIGTKERVRVYRYHLNGDRERITNSAISLALFHAYQEIK